MIDLTPLEVRQKKGDFRRALRGYDPELVNDFLDLAADRMEELVKENMTLRETMEVVQEEVSAYRQKEQALSHALMTAQQLREDARAHAEKEGELMLREAVLAAQAAREEAARQIVREEETLRQVRARRSQMVESFRRLLERELSQLAVIEESLELGRTRSSATRERAAGASPTRSRVKEEGAPTGGRSRASKAAAVEPENVADAEDSAEPTDAAEAIDVAEWTDAAEPTDVAEPIESTESTDAAERGDATEAEAQRMKRLDDEQEDWLSSLIEEP
jgi:cell division initiation protein